ncbi:transposase domain-containing protein [Corynebacterium faecale]|uniref:transposase domain-containing protein n=1 Tax=Corynebacterium faecale TaxID=1758466 RepID=UPI00338E8FCE
MPPHRTKRYSPQHLGELTTIIPPDMVDAALDDTFGRHHRTRRLPSPQVIYLLLAGVFSLTWAGARSTTG